MSAFCKVRPSKSAAGRIERTTRNALLVCALSVVFAMPCRGQAIENFRLVNETYIVISATINSRGPFELILDTGTKSTVIDGEVASRLNLVEIDGAEIRTVTGFRASSTALLSNIAVGAARVEGIQAFIQDTKALRNIDPQIFGILGNDFLSHFNFEIDYAAHTLRIETDAKPLDMAGCERIPIFEVTDRPLVEAGVPSAGDDLTFRLDSAAKTIVFFRHIPSLRVAASGKGAYRIDALGGSGILDKGSIDELAIGSERLHALTVAVSPEVSSLTTSSETGLLPTSLFRSVYFNNREGFVVLNCHH